MGNGLVDIAIPSCRPNWETMVHLFGEMEVPFSAVHWEIFKSLTLPFRAVARTQMRT